MTRLKLSLSHKGLFLVAILLAFELMFVGMLGLLLKSAEDEARKEEHAKVVISQTNRLVSIVYEIGKEMKAYVETRDPDCLTRYDKMMSDIPKIILWLKQNAGGDEKELLNRIDNNLQLGTSILGSVRKQIVGTSLIEMLPTLRAANAKLDPLFKATVPEFLELRHKQEAIEMESPEQQRRVRHLAEMLLYAGVAANLFFAVMLVIFFMKGITARLAVLTDNTRRLADSLPLNSVLSGSDEIADLDRVFHEMAEKLAQAAQKERMIIQSMPVGVVVSKHDGSIDTVNPRLEEMLGYSAQELVGSHLLSLMPQVNQMDAHQFMDNIYPRYIGRIGEFKARKKTGEDLPVEFTLKEFNLSDGPRLLAIIIDITERYEIQQLKQQFVSMVSHDLRTPLTGVHAFLTLAMEGAIEGDRLKARAEAAERSIKRLISLVNELLDLEKLESGLMTMSFAPIAVASILERSDESVAEFAEKHDVTIDLPYTDARIIADGNRLVQVLVNLLSNAIKFSPKGGIVSIVVESTPEFTEFRVKDQGRGVPKEFQEKIFERFRQVETGDATKKGGTGLGLPICKAIVEQHGGKIGVESANGVGSQFWFRIPSNLQTGANSAF